MRKRLPFLLHQTLKAKVQAHGMCGSVGEKQHEVGERSGAEADSNKSCFKYHVNVSVKSRNNSLSQSMINND